MKELPGVHIEPSGYRFKDITHAQVLALEALGCGLLWDYDEKIIWVRYDTAQLEHKMCWKENYPLDDLEVIE